MNYKEEIELYFQQNSITDYSVDYYPCIFGNMVIHFVFNGLSFEIVTDRGDIFMNGKMIHSHCESKNTNDTFELLKKTLLSVLNKELL